MKDSCKEQQIFSADNVEGVANGPSKTLGLAKF